MDRTDRTVMGLFIRTIFKVAHALPKTNSLPMKIGFPKKKLVFQPSIFRCYVSFRECNFVFFFWLGLGKLFKTTGGHRFRP